MRRTTILVAIATAAITGITVGGVTIAVAGEDDTIHGCVNKESRLLRIADSCRSSEKPLTWNEEGEEGDRGPKGDPGPPGSGTGTGGVAGYEIVSRTLNYATDGEEVPFGSGTAIKLTIDIPCRAGKKVLSGGWGTSDEFPGDPPQNSFPLDDTTWRSIFGTFAPAPDRDVTAHAICAAEGTSPPPTTQPPTTTTEPPTTTTEPPVTTT